MPASYSWKQVFYISKVSQRSSHSESINIKRGLMDYNRFVGFNEEQEEHTPGFHTIMAQDKTPP